MDKSFVEMLYEQYLNDLLKYCEILLRYDPKYRQQAEDIVHDVFVVAIQKQDALMHHPNPYRWLAKTCWNKCYTLLRRDLKRRSIVGQQVEYIDGLSVEGQQDAIVRLLHRLDAEDYLDKLYEQLSPLEKAVYPVYFIEDKSLKETAEELGIKVEAINDAIRRIRKKAHRIEWIAFLMWSYPVLELLRDVLVERRP